MEVKEVIEKVKNTPKGKYTRIEYMSNSIKANAANKDKIITKIVKAVVRFVRYENIKGVSPVGKANENEEIIVPHYVKFNSKTNNTLVMVAITNNPKHKAKVQYQINGENATYEEIENIATPSSLKKQAPANVFTLNAKNIISIGD